MLTLYFTPNTCALASHIALEAAGADYRLQRVDFAKQEQRSADYLRINPKARVPALATDRGILTETPAILAYVAQTYPQAHLAPLDDAFEFARAQAFNSYLCSTVHVAHAHRMRGYRWVDDEAAMEAMKRKVPQSVLACFELIENDMLLGPWVMGGHYTICDMYLFTLAQWLEVDGVDTSRLPRVLEHRQRMSADPVVKRVIAAELSTT